MDPHEWTPTGVSFSGGGAKTVGHLGALSYLLSSGVLHTVKDWYGCSGGCLMAVIGAIGGTPTWIRDVVQHFDMASFTGIEEEMLIDFQTQLGVNSGQKLVSIISRFIDTWEPGASNWTFADLARERPGVSLHITATNLTCATLDVFNAKTSPDMLIIDAMRASCAIPLYFTPWRNKKGEIFCDGGLLEPYPWAYVKDKKNTLVIACNDTAIYGRKERNSISTLGEYMSAVMNIVSKSQKYIAPRHWIAINNPTVTMLDFHISATDRMAIYEYGFNAARGWDDFRKRVVARGTPGTPQRCADHCTSPSCCRSQNRTSDIPQSHNPSQHLSAVPDLCSGALPRARRWSL
jgi:predicted acylesterase/phospholipase RssA